MAAMRDLFARQLADSKNPDGGIDQEALADVVTECYARGPAESQVQAERLRVVLENIAQGVCFFDSAERLIVSNHRYAEMYGLRPEDVTPGASLRDIVDQRYRVGSTPAMTSDTFLNWREQVIRHRQPNDSVTELQNGRVIAIRHQPMERGGWVATHEDITDRRETERQLAHLARHHAVTGLPNRAMLAEQLQEVLRRLTEAATCAVLCLTVDGLRGVHDTLGRAVGDGLMRILAERLRRSLRPADLLAQQGDNEFVIVQCDNPQPTEAVRLAEALLELVAQPALLSGQRLVVTASIGIAVATTAWLDAETMVKNAGIAMHRAQTEGRGAYRLFEAEMDEEMQARRLLEIDLRDAVDRMAFELHYQPQIDVMTRRVTKFEALLRWRHATRGAVPPSLFIPMAEQIGLIDRIGGWVLEKACVDAASWPDGIGVAVNVSPRQFVGGALPRIVADVLRRTGLSPVRLELEITETCVMTDAVGAAATLRALRASGVRIAMDDFGTGYSSLSYLPVLPFDKIKIDQAFVAKLGEGPAHTAIIRAIINLSESLGMTCTAEGVETVEQLLILASEGCPEVQGRLLGWPRPAREIAELLRVMNPQESAPAAADGPVAAEIMMSALPPRISFEQIVESANDIVIVTTPDLDLPGPSILYVNPAFTKLTGYTESEALGASPRILQGPGTSRATLDAIATALKAGREVHEKVLNYAKNGTPYWLDLRIVPLRDDSGVIVQFVAIERDVTGDKRRLDELEYLADRDTLTGIANRRALLRVMDAELRSARTYGGASPCLAYVDVDHFKRINDMFGHATGDAVLFGLADRLAENVRRVDTVGRIGGEEFAVCMPSITLRDAAAIGERLRRAVMAQAFDTPSGPLHITISVGVSEAEGDEQDLTKVMSRADQAMYAAKRSGRDRVETEPAMIARSLVR